MRGPINAIKQGLKPHLPYLAVLGLITLLVGLPLLELKLMRGHDSVPYFLRTIEFYEGLRSGNVFLRMETNFTKPSLWCSSTLPNLPVH